MVPTSIKRFSIQYFSIFQSKVILPHSTVLCNAFFKIYRKFSFPSLSKQKKKSTHYEALSLFHLFQNIQEAEDREYNTNKGVQINQTANQTAENVYYGDVSQNTDCKACYDSQYQIDDKGYDKAGKIILFALECMGEYFLQNIHDMNSFPKYKLVVVTHN